MTNDTGLDTARLNTAIRQTINKLNNSLVSRKEHPTYGVTKAQLRSDFDRLCGLLEARSILLGEAPPVSDHFSNLADTAEDFKTDLYDLYNRVKAS